jgi:hypothetical protein
MGVGSGMLQMKIRKNEKKNNIKASPGKTNLIQHEASPTYLL